MSMRTGSAWLGSATTEEIADMAREAFELLPSEEQIAFLIGLLEGDEILRDEIRGYLDADAEGAD